MKYVYLAGPMSKGSLMDHVRVAVEVADKIMDAGGVPFLPQLSILSHLHRPREYESWMAYDLAIVERFDALLRLPGESSGADREIEHAKKYDKPVFYHVETYINTLNAYLHDLHDFEERDVKEPILSGFILNPIVCKRCGVITTASDYDENKRSYFASGEYARRSFVVPPCQMRGRR